MTESSSFLGHALVRNIALCVVLLTSFISNTVCSQEKNATAPPAEVLRAVNESVISVHAVSPDFKGTGYGFRGDFFWTKALKLSDILAVSVGIYTPERIKNVPEHLGNTRYDIQVKVDLGKLAPIEQWPTIWQEALVQHVLTQRFALSSHYGSALTTVLALDAPRGETVLKSPSKARPVSDGPTCVFRGTPTVIEADACTMTALAARLGNYDGLEIIDDTGLKALYQIHLTFDNSRTDTSEGHHPELPSLRDACTRKWVLS